jgi:hypothetical protein
VRRLLTRRIERAQGKVTSNLQACTLVLLHATLAPGPGSDDKLEVRSYPIALIDKTAPVSTHAVAHLLCCFSITRIRSLAYATNFESLWLHENGLTTPWRRASCRRLTTTTLQHTTLPCIRLALRLVVSSFDVLAYDCFSSGSIVAWLLHCTHSVTSRAHAAVQSVIMSGVNEMAVSLRSTCPVLSCCFTRLTI